MAMKDWLEQLNYFLKMSRKGILTKNGTISHVQAIKQVKKICKIS